MENTTRLQIYTLYSPESGKFGLHSFSSKIWENIEDIEKALGTDSDYIRTWKTIVFDKNTLDSFPDVCLCVYSQDKWKIARLLIKEYRFDDLIKLEQQYT